MSNSSSSSLTKEQMRLIEEKRQKALQRLAERGHLQNEPANKIPKLPIENKNVSNVMKPHNLPPSVSNFFTKSNNIQSSGTSSIKANSSIIGSSMTSFSSFKPYHNNKPPQSRPGVSSVLVNNQPNTSSTAPMQNSAAKIVLVNMELSSHTHFEVHLSSFYSGFSQLTKDLKTRSYDKNSRKWSYHLSEYKQLSSIVSKADGLKVENFLPAAILKSYNDLINNVTHTQKPTVDWTRLDQNLVNSLMPFQREGVERAILNNGRLLFGDDMGLGKTLQSIAVASYYWDEWPLLIVVPSSVRHAWREQLRRWIPNLVNESEYGGGGQSIAVVDSIKDCPYATESFIKVVIISYDLLVKCKSQLEPFRFKVVIMDESHMLKNCKAARTIAAKTFLTNAHRVLLLSGTPALSRPSELFTQIESVAPTLFKNFLEFGIRYCDGKQTQFGWNFNGSSHMNELRLLLEKRVMLRRLKTDVLTQLPSKVREVIILDPKSISKETLRHHARRMSQSSLSKRQMYEALLSYFHDTGSVKVKAICDYVTDILESDKKFLLFAHHGEVMDGLTNLLQSKKVDYIRIDGSTSSEKRRIFTDKFQLDENVKAAILSITAASTGLNLTAANLVIFCELYWNPGILIQAEDRAYRIGQMHDCVNVQYLVAKETADDQIMPLIKSKLEILKGAGLNKDSFTFASVKNVQAKDSEQPTILRLIEEAIDDVEKCPFPSQEDAPSLYEQVANNNSKDTSTFHNLNESNESLLSTSTCTNQQPQQQPSQTMNEEDLAIAQALLDEDDALHDAIVVEDSFLGEEDNDWMLINFDDDD